MVQKKPEWLRKTNVPNPNRDMVEEMLKQLNLNTVCSEAACPNYGECFGRKTATFMILGTKCTRNCRFCNVHNGTPQPVDSDEPKRIAQAAAQLELRYLVITSVTRDDLPDGGAEHFAQTVSYIKTLSPQTAVETLIPDFLGDLSALKTVADAAPAVISHNVETVPRLYELVRPAAEYKRSLAVIAAVKKLNPAVRSKTGVMLGLGETREEVLSLMDDLRSVGCEFLTLGQYLAPSKLHYPVKEYIHPDIFEEYRVIALEKGFNFVASAPYVRSSYHAGEALGLE
jgi:lipoic acid synthetase